ncbi:unnamed protein product [Kuraishia capsulata CBS 1993]|uniref:Amino acid permease/ SLC12A domain-containing protein n=1 Tax=Kuraishia capsulata CBS 1993 TaxID=1382522 RepID=W6MN07_9ASCO|nr:uncharacterized protein KUCA_T00003966001 [Kuraishia capsulata CBS 1993]CDK27986.1 unnamed protein product [Kuraishia capsulata CBS 1993]
MLDKDLTTTEITEAPELRDDASDVSKTDFEGNVIGEIEGQGKLRRSFKTRHIQIVALGSNIGSGIFISTGKSLRFGGPGNMVVGYTIVCSMVICVLQILTELSILYPSSGNFIDFTERFLDPAAAFAIGMGEWLAWTTVMASEGSATTSLISYWTTAVPTAAWMSIILVVTFLIHALPNIFFAEFQYVTSVMKVVMLLMFTISCIIMCAGGGPTGSVHNGQFWDSSKYDIFKNGVRGVSYCCLYCLWGVGDQVFVGMLAGEARSPRFSLPRTVKSAGLRIFGFFMILVVFITLLVPETDTRLYGTAGSIASSPFIIALNDAGIKVLPDILNAVMAICLILGGLEPIYIAARCLRHLAVRGMLPKFIGKVDSKGRPRWSLAITFVFTAVFTYMNCTGSGATVFSWFSSVTTTIFMSVWVVLGIVSIRFHMAVRRQKSEILNTPFAYKDKLFPIGPLFVSVGSLLILIGLFYASLFPVGGSPNAYDFFETYLGVPLVLVTYLVYKIVFRTKFVRSADVDLVEGYRPLSDDEIIVLETYYSMPWWRRLWSYVDVRDGKQLT